jgi:hypothetical protein
VSVKIYIQVQVCLCLLEIKYLGPEYKIYGPLVRGGQANPQTLGLIPLLVIRKLLKLLKGASPQICITNPQIANQQVSKKYCKTLCQKSQLSFKLIFYFVIILIGQYMLFCQEQKHVFVGFRKF